LTIRHNNARSLLYYYIQSVKERNVFLISGPPSQWYPPSKAGAKVTHQFFPTKLFCLFL